MWEQLGLFVIFLKSSALAIGGLASLPLLRADLVPQYVTDAGIVQALAVGRLAPGPNGLYIVSLGYIVAGWTGALYALIGASVAPLVMLPATALARRWLVRFARQRNGRSMAEKLASEIVDAANSTGGAVRRKEETHRMAESNKAFSHFRY